MGTASELIREARHAAGLTQVELARRASTSQSAVAAYESGRKTPTVDTLQRLLQAAGRRLESVPTREGKTSRLRARLRANRDRILEIAREHRASHVRVFGSVARGQERAGSDVDLLVRMEPEASLLDQVRLRRALIELLGVQVDVVSEGGLRPQDINILEEATPL